MGVRGERQGTAHEFPMRHEEEGFTEGQQQKSTEETPKLRVSEEREVLGHWV